MTVALFDGPGRGHVERTERRDSKDAQISCYNFLMQSRQLQFDDARPLLVKIKS